MEHSNIRFRIFVDFSARDVRTNERAFFDNGTSKCSRIFGGCSGALSAVTLPHRAIATPVSSRVARAGVTN